MPNESQSQLSRELTLISWGGCLAMVFIVCCHSPVTTEFLRSLGAEDWHFGVVGGLPLILLSMQFFGAFLANRVRQRKKIFIVVTIVGRLFFLLIALVPVVMAPDSPVALLLVIGLMALYLSTSNLAIPLWFSWMGDLIPSRILNRYWGVRMQYMTITWTVTSLVIAYCTFQFADVPVVRLFQGLVLIGVVAGVVDILLFCCVGEQQNTIVVDRSALDVLMQPLRDPQYRSFIRFQGAWTFSAMFGAAFMQIYVLKVLQIPLWQTNYIWCTAGLGSALVAGAWGKITDSHGTRPVMILTTILKPMIVIVFLLIDSRSALVVLPFAFFLDSMLNAGKNISANGYMLKMSPNENRSMFIAAVTALTGLAGGLGAIVGGLVLDWADGLQLAMLGRTWNNYHLIFLLSLLMRLGCIGFALKIKEPASSEATVVLSYFRGTWPLRMINFPIGIYKRLTPGRPDDDDAEE